MLASGKALPSATSGSQPFGKHRRELRAITAYTMLEADKLCWMSTR